MKGNFARPRAIRDATRTSPRGIWASVASLMLATACCTVGDRQAPAAESTTQTQAAAVMGGDCNTLKMPGDEGVPGLTFVQAMSNTYGSGGVMISVHVGNPDEQPGYGDLGTVRVWGGTGNQPASISQRPPDSEIRVQSPTDWDLDDNNNGYPWAGSTIVRVAPTDTMVWTYVEVTLTDGMVPPNPTRPFSYWLTWSRTGSTWGPSGYRHATRYPDPP